MKCISCETEINPKWKHAIDINVCPFCGNNIMEEKLKDLLKSLGEILTELKQYPAELDDWLLSNFNYIKNDLIKSEITLKKSEDSIKQDDNKKFIVKIETDDGEREVEAEKIQDEEQTSEFFKRAEAIKPNIDGFQSASQKTESLKRKKAEHLKKIATQIKRAGNYETDEDVGEYSYDQNESLEVNDDLEDLFNDQKFSSSLDGSSLMDDEIPAAVLSMASNAKNKGSQTNAADLLKLQRSLNRSQESRRNFESGESRGKGGFSRS